MYDYVFLFNWLFVIEFVMAKINEGASTVDNLTYKYEVGWWANYII